MSKTKYKNKEKEIRVIKILDSETIILNVGEEENINENTIFEILGKQTQIIDPVTKESLGFLDNIKETVSPIKIFPKMCLCSHITYTSSLISGLSAISSIYTGAERKKILNVEQSQISNDPKIDKTIKVGDKARKKVNLPLPNESTKN